MPRPPSTAVEFRLAAAAADMVARREWWRAAVAHPPTSERVAVLEEAYVRHFRNDPKYHEAVVRAARAYDPNDPAGHREVLLISYIAQIEAGLVPGITAVSLELPVL